MLLRNSMPRLNKRKQWSMFLCLSIYIYVYISESKRSLRHTDVTSVPHQPVSPFLLVFYKGNDVFLTLENSFEDCPLFFTRSSGLV